MDNLNIYQVLRSNLSLINYAENNGINLRQIGRSQRSNNPFGTGTNSFRIDLDNPEYWYNYIPDGNKTGYGGDIVDLCALLNHAGDKHKALHELVELLPENLRKKYAPKIDRYIKDKTEIQDKIKSSHEALISGQYDNITGHWKDYLYSRGITDEQIFRLKIGFEVNEFRLIIPRFNFDGIEVLYYNTRRMPNADGIENEQELKYCKPLDYVNTFLRSVPLGLHTLNRKSKYLVLTEGDFDVLNFEREGFAVLGKEILESKNWNIVLSNAENFEGGIILAFDSDTTGKTFTKQAATKLFENNIIFHVISLPENCKDINDFYCRGGNLNYLVEVAQNGLDFILKEFLPPEGFNSLSKTQKKALYQQVKNFIIQTRRRGADKSELILLINSLSEFYPIEWLNEVLKEADKEQSEYEIVEALRNKYDLIYNPQTGFYQYNEVKAIWQLRDDKYIATLIRLFLGHSTNAKKIFSTTEHLKVAVFGFEPVEKFNRQELFAFQNGTLHYHRKAEEKSFFKSACANDYVTYRVNYEFDEKASCDFWLFFLDVIMCHDERRIMCLQEFCGYCLLNECKFQKALILRDPSGQGSNGKSTLLNVIRMLFGYKNTSSIEPAQFGDEHAIMQLKDSLINICTDALPDISGGEANLKKAITGESITGRYLYQQYCSFEPRAKIIFAVNGNLRMKDNSGSMKRRFLLINCEAHFVDGEPNEQDYEYTKDINITKKLLKELPGIFNWCLDGAFRLIRQGHFTQTLETAEMELAFNSFANNNLEDFISYVEPDFYDVDGRGRKLTRAEIYAKYLVYCENEGIEQPLSSRKFHGIFREALKSKSIPYKERTDAKGKRYYVFLEQE